MKEKKTARPLEWKEAKKMLLFLEGVEAYHHLLILAVGFFTGFRISDMLALKYEDFQEDKDTLNIGKRKTTFQKPVPIIDELRRIVNLCQLRLKRKDNNYLFVRSRFRSNKPISRAAATTRIQEAFEYVYIQGVQLPGHTLRKTFAFRYFNLCRKEKGDYWAINEVANLLNHTDTDVTCRYIGLEKPIVYDDVFDNFF